MPAPKAVDSAQCQPGQVLARVKFVVAAGPEKFFQHKPAHEGLKVIKKVFEIIRLAEHGYLAIG